VASSEKLIEFRNSWFSAKTMLVDYLRNLFQGKALTIGNIEKI